MDGSDRQEAAQEQELNDVIEIRDPEIDAGEVMARIRANIHARRADGRRPSVFPSSSLPPQPTTQDVDLQYHLAQAKEACDRVWIDVSLAPSPVAQVPILGWLWGLVREQAHRLVLYYVETLASRQRGFNEHVVNTLGRLAVAREEMVTLREEVAELRRRLADLEDP